MPSDGEQGEVVDEVLLSARAMSKRVNDGTGRREVIHDVSLEVRRGEFIVVHGESGSGKTTLLALLAGMLLPTSGEVWLGREAISRLRDHQRAALRREKVGYVFQDFGLMERMTALDNVLLPLLPMGDSIRGLPYALELLDRLGLRARAGEQVDRLSGGERQRVALARAFVTRPSVLLLDEPSAHLDEARTRAFLDDLVGTQREGTAILVASHDPRICDDPRVTRRLELRDGALV